MRGVADQREPMRDDRRQLRNASANAAGGVMSSSCPSAPPAAAATRCASDACPSASSSVASRVGRRPDDRHFAVPAAAAMPARRHRRETIEMRGRDARSRSQKLATTAVWPVGTGLMPQAGLAARPRARHPPTTRRAVTVRLVGEAQLGGIGTPGDRRGYARREHFDTRLGANRCDQRGVELSILHDPC